MSVAYDIRALLASVNITASVNNMPLNVTDAIGIFETGGMPPDYTHGMSPDIDDRPSFQIIVHNASKPAATAIIESILATIDGKMNILAGDQTYTEIRQSTPAIYLGKIHTDAGETNEYSLNFTARTRR